MKKMNKKRLDAMHYTNLLTAAGITAEDLADNYFAHNGEKILSSLLVKSENPQERAGLLTLMAYDVTRENPSSKPSFDEIQKGIVGQLCTEDNIDFFETNIINKDLDEKGNIVEFNGAKEVLEARKNTAILGMSKVA